MDGIHRPEETLSLRHQGMRMSGSAFMDLLQESGGENARRDVGPDTWTWEVGVGDMADSKRSTPAEGVWLDIQSTYQVEPSPAPKYAHCTLLQMTRRERGIRKRMWCWISRRHIIFDDNIFLYKSKATLTRGLHLRAISRYCEPHPVYSALIEYSVP